MATTVPGGHGHGHHGHHGLGHHGHHGLGQGQGNDDDDVRATGSPLVMESVPGSSGQGPFDQDMSGLLASVPGSSGAPGFVTPDVGGMAPGVGLAGMDSPSTHGGMAVPFSDNTVVTVPHVGKPH